MAGLPTYAPGGRQQTDPMRANAVNADAFGGMEARAAGQFGQQIQQLGGKMLQIEEQEKQKDDAASVISAKSEGITRMRDALYKDGGIYSRTGTAASGMTDDALKTAETIRNDIIGKLKDPDQIAAFESTWSSYSDSLGNTIAANEADQRVKTRTAAKTSALANLTTDALVNFDKPEMLSKNFDDMRRMIRANPDNLPAEMVAQLERESISSMHVAVIQRMAQDNPGAALDYYEKNKGTVFGADHASANKFISVVSNVRKAKDAVSEIYDNAEAGNLVRSVIGAESAGDPGAVSPVGAAGLMQLMPATAREQAVQLGMREVAGMTDDQLAAHWKTPQGQKDNVRVGSLYLNKMLSRYKGDVEAALIGYNAGPGNADKWLNSNRDYASLPKREETEPYVRKVIKAWKGLEIGEGGSNAVQDALRGGAGGKAAYYQGDAKAFLRGKLQAQHGSSHIDDMDGAMADRLAAVFSQAPDYVREGLDVLSGKRSSERQEQLWAAALKKYGTADRARKWVAPPGRSQHEHGNAADLGWKGGKFSSAPPEVKKWVHANAGKFGLKFPLGNEDWHIEAQETRGGKGANAKMARVGASQDPASARVRDAANAGWGDAADDSDSAGAVEIDTPVGNPADIYTKAVTPFQMASTSNDPAMLAAQAREQYADQPDLLAEIERQLTDRAVAGKSQMEARQKQLKMELAASVFQGGSVRDADPAKLMELGPEGVKSVMELESSWARDGDTDETTYYRLSKMTPEELASADLMEYSGKLSRADFQKWADRQADATRGTGQSRSTSMTRTQVIGLAEKALGIDGNTPAGALRMMGLNKSLDDRITAFMASNSGKEPNGVEMQDMVDDLIIQDKTDTWGPDPEKYAFELKPEEIADFSAAASVEDIPQDRIRAVGTVGRAFLSGAAPDETNAVDFYNDMVRVGMGAAPMPPAYVDKKLRQALKQGLGRQPTDEEVASAYRRRMLKAMAPQ